MLSSRNNRRTAILAVLLAFVVPGAARAMEPNASQPVTRPAVTGYMWLGNLQKDGTIVPATVELGDQGAVRSLDQLSADANLVALNGLFVRGGLPRNDADYFRGQPIVGVVEVGTKVKLIAPPDKIARASGLVQLWGHVEVPNTVSR